MDQETVVDPAFVLKAARTFLTACQPAEAAEAGDGSQDGWEGAGCLLWDIASIAEQAELLMAHNIQDILQTVIAASIGQERWRALEICLGILGNLACHRPARQALLGSRPLAELVLERALWVDDPQALCEACRLLSALCLSTKMDDRWWELATQPEQLGRIVWTIDNSLSPLLLERALALVCSMLAAAAAGGQLPTLSACLLELDILASATAILISHLRQLEREQREFGGGGGEGDEGGGGIGNAATAAEGTGGSGEELAALAGRPTDDEEGAAGGAEAAATAAAPAAAPGPEFGEAVALEALSMVDGLTACEAGAAAASRAGKLVDAVLRLMELSDSGPLRLVCVSLLAPLEGVGARLAARPGALHAALQTLAAAAAGRSSGEAEAEAGWALCSAALHAACSAGVATAEAEAGVGAAGGSPNASGAAAGAGASREGGQAAPDPEALLAVAAEHSGVLLGDWAAGGGQAAAQQQRYCLQQLQVLLVRQGAEGELPEGLATFAVQLAEALAGEAGAAT